MNDSRIQTIAVVGSSSAVEGDDAYTVARSLGTALVDRSFRVITGGRAGVMEAACRGAHESEHYVEGRTVGILPNRDAGGANPWVDIALPTGMNIARNAIIAHSDGLIAVGGGSGTLTEMAMAWQLGRPVVAVDVDGWSRRLAGEKFDERPAPVAGEDDRIWRAETGVEAAERIADLLEDARAQPRQFD